jgi:hypothetical protein
MTHAQILLGLWLLKWSALFLLGLAIMVVTVPLLADYGWKINLLKRRVR